MYRGISAVLVFISQVTKKMDQLYRYLLKCKLTLTEKISKL